MIEGHLILSLKLQETCYQYWPESGLIQFREYTVDLMEEKVMEGFTKRTISVYNEKVILFCISVHMTCSLQTASAHQVFQLHMTNWNPDGSIPELAPLVSVINETSAIQRRTGNKSVLVHCRSDNVHNVALYYLAQLWSAPQYEYCGSVYLPQGIFTHCPPLTEESRSHCVSYNVGPSLYLCPFPSNYQTSTELSPPRIVGPGV